MNGLTDQRISIHPARNGWIVCFTPKPKPRLSQVIAATAAVVGKGIGMVRQLGTRLSTASAADPALAGSVDIGPDGVQPTPASPEAETETIASELQVALSPLLGVDPDGSEVYVCRDAAEVVMIVGELMGLGQIAMVAPEESGDDLEADSEG